MLLWPSDTGVGNWVHFGNKMAQPRLLPPTSFNIMLEFQVLLIGSGWWLNPQVIIGDIDYHLKLPSIKIMGRVIIVPLAELLQGFHRVLGRDSAKLFRWNFPCTAGVKGCHCQYDCIFHSSREEWRTKNSCKGGEEDQKRVRTKVRGISCPINITISRHVQ